METATPRPGEELPVAELSQLLGGDVSVSQFPAGHSNLTYLVRIGERELVLRRPPRGFRNIAAGHDMRREYRILTALAGRYAKAPRPVLFVEEEDSPIGCPFYCMERVTGVILRPPIPSELDLTPELLRGVSLSLVATLAELHAVDHVAAGLADLARGDGYLERQVTGWTGRYSKAQTDEIPAMATVAEWLVANVPASGPPTLIHNDFKYDNVVLDPQNLTRAVAVLDWEMATIGDPLADLGTSLAYWIEPDDPDDMRSLGFVLTATRGNLTRAEVAAAYADASGRDVTHIVFHYVLGLFKVAVIAQQIYARFHAGHTSDARFGAMIHAVRALSTAAVCTIDRDRL